MIFFFFLITKEYVKSNGRKTGIFEKISNDAMSSIIRAGHSSQKNIQSRRVTIFIKENEWWIVRHES